MSHAASFDITTASEFFCKIVVPQYDDFVADNSSSRHALLATIVVYHMYEWVYREKFTQAHFCSAHPSIARLANSFELARNIVNGTKHFLPKATTRTQTGFSSAFSDGFVRSLIVQFPDGSEKSVDTFLRELVNFWRDEEQKGSF